MRIVPTHRHPHAQAYRDAGYWPQRTLGDLFALTLERYAARPAIIDGERRLTFAELDRLSRQVADGLRAHGCSGGDVIAYQLPNWWEAAVVFLAAARLGAVVHPLLPSFREAELRFTLRQSGARALVIPGALRGCDHRDLVAALWPDLPELRAVFVARAAATPGLRRFADLLAGAPTPSSANAAVAADAVALLMYTSGTSAEPKGVLHTHNSLAAEVMSLARVHQLTPADRTLMPSPLTHISGVLHAILAPALLGTSAVLMERWDPRRALALLTAEGITYMVGVPTFLQDLVDQPASEPTALRLFSCGGAPVPPALLRRAGARFPGCVAKRVYGSTELPTLTTTDAADASTHGTESEGRPIWPNEVRIADSAGNGVPANVEGEVQGRAPECCAGYLDAALNAEAFTADGWFRTGDLGVLDADGYLRISGRLKDIIIRKGEKISVKEVEDLLAEHPSVAEAVVVARADAATGERACALVRLRPGTHLDLGGLTEFLDRRGLAKHKWPEQLEVVTDFPRTASGKIRRNSLKE